MSLRAALALILLMALAGCKKDAALAPQPAAKPAPTVPPAAAQPAKTPSPLPTAAALMALFDKATRIEAKSGAGQKPTWSKDLPPEDVAALRAGIGDAAFSPHAPRCLPTVVVTLYRQTEELAKLGAFCDADKVDALMRFDIDGETGSLTAKDPAKVKAALESPVDL